MKKLLLLIAVVAALVLTGCPNAAGPVGEGEADLNPLLGTWERTFTGKHGTLKDITSIETFTFNADLTGVVSKTYTPHPPVDGENYTIQFTYTYERKPISYTRKYPPYDIIEADGIVTLKGVHKGKSFTTEGRYKCISDTQLKFTDYWYEPKSGLLTYTKK